MVKSIYIIKLLIMNLENNLVQDSSMDLDDITQIHTNIKIQELIEQISQIVKSPNKEDFIKLYNKSHEQIKQVDEILYKPSTIDESTDIKTLFEMLKHYDAILEKGDISVLEYKTLLDLVNLLDSKLKNSFMDVKELK